MSLKEQANDTFEESGVLDLKMCVLKRAFDYVSNDKMLRKLSKEFKEMPIKLC